MQQLILVPGLLCDAALWTAQRDALRPSVAVRTFDHSLGATATELARQLLSGAPERFALAGLSMGGYVAMEVCRLAPERVTHLALLDTNDHADTADSTARRTAQVQRAKAGDFANVVEDLIPLLVHEDHVSDPAKGGVLRAMAHRLGPEVFARQQNVIMGREDQSITLSGLSMPALILGGEQDKLSPPDKHHAMASRLKNATLTIIPHCGHMAPLEAPEVVTQAMQAWLAR